MQKHDSHWDRYQIYVKIMEDLGIQPKSFDEWLDS